MSHAPSVNRGKMPDQLALAKCKALVLVGGFGTRLQPVFARGPKAMAPIGGRPFLSYLMSQLAASGFSEVVLCLGYGNKQIKEWVEGQPALGLRVACSVEEEPLGTGGAIRLAVSNLQIESSFFVMNGDSILELDFAEMLRAHHAHSGTGTVALAHVADTGRYGAVQMDDFSRITAFQEKSGSGSLGYINGGTYIFEPRIVERMVNRGPVSLERSVLPALCPGELYGHRCHGYFIDIGIPEDFQRAQTELGGLSWL